MFKWGDGGAHLHVVVVARPQGMRQLWGMFLPVWMNVLPPLLVAEWEAIRGLVAAGDRQCGGRIAPGWC